MAARQTIWWRALGAVVLGALLAKWSWALFAPRAAAVAVAPPKQPSAEAGALFGAAGAQSSPPAVAQPDVALVGVFAPKSDGRGFAVLKLGGKQEGLGLGESTSSGAKLVEIHSDYVMLERGGARQRVELESQQARAEAKPAPAAQNVAQTASGQAAAQAAAQAAKQMQLQNQARSP